MKIIVGTKNQRKIDVVRSIFKEVLQVTELEITAYDAHSKVPEAPHDKETYEVHSTEQRSARL